MKKGSRGRYQDTRRQSGSRPNTDRYLAPIRAYDARNKIDRVPFRKPKPYQTPFGYSRKTYEAFRFRGPVKFGDLNLPRVVKNKIRQRIQNLPGVKDFICARRKIRAEVLHALGLKKSGKGGTKNFTENSKIKC